jgi:mannose-1-phosphate guanylyltransferase
VTFGSPLRFTRPANRLISDSGAPTSLATAAALLSVAVGSRAGLVAILASDFWVASESIVMAAIESVFRSFHRVPGRVVTLGMVDTHTELDENYLVVAPDNAQAGALIQAKVNQPALPIARHVAYLFG